MLTLGIKLDNKLCVCVGGGSIAEGRVKKLCEAGAKVIVISPKVTDQIHKWKAEGRIEWWPELYKEGRLPRAFLVIAATDKEEVNARCAREARDKGALVNRADNKEECDFVWPAEVNMGDVRMTVSTGKISPRINVLLRMDLENRYRVLAEVLPDLGEYRREVRKILPTSRERAEFWRKMLTPEDFEMILGGRWNIVEEKIRRAISCIGPKP